MWTRIQKDNFCTKIALFKKILQQPSKNTYRQTLTWYVYIWISCHLTNSQKLEPGFFFGPFEPEPLEKKYQEQEPEPLGKKIQEPEPLKKKVRSQSRYTICRLPSPGIFTQLIPQPPHAVSTGRDGKGCCMLGYEMDAESDDMLICLIYFSFQW